jgi:hypothetical protein
LTLFPCRPNGAAGIPVFLISSNKNFVYNILFDDARLPLSVFATIASIFVHLLDALPDHQAHPKASNTSDLHTFHTDSLALTA